MFNHPGFAPKPPVFTYNNVCFSNGLIYREILSNSNLFNPAFLENFWEVLFIVFLIS